MSKFVGAIVLLILASAQTRMTVAQDSTTEMDKIYADESHCLTLPEIRSEKDNSISCYCRDAIAEARYVYHTYVASGKDRNLAGTVLVLVTNVSQMCGESGKDFNGWNEVEHLDWRWDGPEVVRTYPSDEEIRSIPMDSKGFRSVKYSVRLVYRNQQGTVTKFESFIAQEKELADSNAKSPLRPSQKTP